VAGQQNNLPALNSYYFSYVMFTENFD